MVKAPAVTVLFWILTTVLAEAEPVTSPAKVIVEATSVTTPVALTVAPPDKVVQVGVVPFINKIWVVVPAAKLVTGKKPVILALLVKLMLLAAVVPVTAPPMV